MRLARIDGDRPLRDHPAAGRHTADIGDLLVLIVPIKCLEIELQLVVEEAVLRTKGIGGQRFRAEGVVRRLRDEETTRLEAGRDIGIDQRRRTRVELDARLPGKLLEAQAASEWRAQRRQHRTGQAARRGRGQLLLVLARVAATGDEAQAVGQVKGQLAERRDALGIEARGEARGRDIPLAEKVQRFLILAEIEGTDHITQPSVVVRREPHFDRGLLGQIGDVTRKTGQIGAEIDVRTPPCGEDGQRAEAKIADHRSADAIEFIIEEAVGASERHAAAVHKATHAAAEGRGGDRRSELTDRGVGARIGHADAVLQRGDGVARLGQQYRARTLAMLVVVIGDQSHRPAVGRLDQQRRANRLTLVVVIAVGDIAVAIDDLSGDA